MLYDLSRDSAGRSQLKLTYDKIAIETESDKAGKQKFSADTDAFPSEMSRLLSLLKGHSITIWYDSLGNATDIAGVEGAVSAALNAIPPGQTSVRKAVEEQLIGFVGADFLKNTLEPVGQLFPDSAVKTGDTWSRQVIQQSGIRFTSQSVFTVTSLKDSLAKLKMESTINSDKAIPLTVSGYRVNARLSGSQMGEFLTQKETGILTTAHIKTRLNGDIEILGKTVPLSVVIEKDMKLKKL